MKEPKGRHELRVIRRRIGLTQAQMAARLQVSKSAYEKYERGERSLPCAILDKARGMAKEHFAKLDKPVSAQALPITGHVRSSKRFDRWIQTCWLLFFASAVWLITRITALQTGTDYLRLGPNDEVLALVFLLFIGLLILLANETWRRVCFGLPIRNQRFR